MTSFKILVSDLDRSWMSFANCADVAAAKAVCQGCVVRDDCLDYALATVERHGIWGGLTEKDRREVAKQRRLAARQEAA